MNILYVESSRSWGGQEYRTCLETNWLNARGHQAWLICNPNSEVLLKARELGTRAIPMPLRRRIDPVCWWRLWRFCRRNQIDLIKTYSSKDHWLAFPLYLGGIPVARARCITDRSETNGALSFSSMAARKSSLTHPSLSVNSSTRTESIPPRLRSSAR